MIIRIVAGALALGLFALPSVSWADDPHDPAMRTAAARAQDRAIIRQLNLADLRKVRARCPAGQAMAGVARMAARSRAR